MIIGHSGQPGSPTDAVRVLHSKDANGILIVEDLYTVLYLGTTHFNTCSVILQDASKYLSIDKVRLSKS